MCGAGCPHCPPGSQGSCLPGDGMTCSGPGGAALGNPVSPVARALSKRSSTGRMGGGSRGRELCCPGPGSSFAPQPTPWLGSPGIVFLPGTRVTHTGIQWVRGQLQATHLSPMRTAQGPSPPVLGRPGRWALNFYSLQEEFRQGGLLNLFP